MPTIKFPINDQDVEITLTMDELIQLLYVTAKKRKPFQIPSPAEQTKLIEPQKDKRITEKTTINECLPPDVEVKQYLLSKPEYRHTLFDVQRHFFKDRAFISRGYTKKMYHKTFRQLQSVRAQIEKEQGGKFYTVIGENRVNEYVFEKTPIVVEEVSNQQ